MQYAKHGFRLAYINELKISHIKIFKKILRKA